MELKTTAKKALLGLIDLTPQLENIFKDSKEFADVVQYLVSRRFDDEDVSIPPLKDIYSDLGLTSSKFGNIVLKMYNSLFGWEKNLSFGNTEVIFHLEFYKIKAQFMCKNLNFIPRVGEEVKIQFVKGKMGGSFYYVDNINHRFYGDEHIIVVHLKEGFYNQFWHFKRDEAIEKGQLSIQEQFKLSEYELKQIVKSLTWIWR
ncbi:hypothetical protein LRR18_00845 [Mangrovimonas sp. AS39]|uniref:hypothetical protein n=1 Tax=Mangrovimonas futianensis TaxID=2895523 RepID=UPI001E29A99C|nr:hypothetical protein [Mangrovimonas futianensis]MCF1190114.1 hypothetical protein [Mangrovimonas futianensis]MCF1194135.1 hypothetical protein [Mangrovimonas futianensis]